MLLTVLVAVALVSTPEKLCEGSDPAWSPDGTHVAYLTPFGRAIQIRTLDGELVSTIEAKKGDKWLEIDSFAWFPNGQEMLISEHETNAWFSGEEFVKSHVLRAPLEGMKFTVAKTGELDEGEMSSTTNVYRSLRFFNGSTQAYAVSMKFLPVGSTEIAETAPAMIDLVIGEVSDWQALADLREFHLIGTEGDQMVLTWNTFQVYSQEDSEAFLFKMDWVGGFDFSDEAGVVCWTGRNSVMFRKLEEDLIIEYHLKRELYALGRISLSSDGKRVVFSALEETDLLNPENDKVNVYMMDVPPELLQD